ncbi:sensor histidine kinase [Nocardioides sp. cx-169]|uniref:sensor histidine kinase n=1 Tax=Nocardioides sp. cx-169 TaxID=2899080 RepID=UPI001E5499B1|nr:sensor histidine kinase [Nocardioides sp. cx-169]MCD4532605.1 sensor histidine kinase [Nocardioides sp. cx-169]
MTRSLVPPRVLDVVAAGLCAAAMLVELFRLEEGEPSVAAVAAIVLACLPVLIRRQHPELALVAAMVLIFAITETSRIASTIALSAIVCGYALASARGRKAIWSVPPVMGTVLLILATYSSYPLLSFDTVRNLALVLLPTALGVIAHDRRELLSGLVERAETAERTREEETRRRVGEERLRIARDVHDVVAHAMVAINVQAGVGAHLLERDPAQARATLRDIKRVSGEALGDLRSMLGVLRGPDDEDAPIRPAADLSGLDDLRDGLAAAGVEVDLRIDPDTFPLPAPIGATGYRIVQEALTNVLRHAGTTSARVRVGRSGDRVLIEVEDDGSGTTPPDQTGSGNGVRGMRERAAAAGGTLEAGPRPEGGWRVAASLPAGVTA